MDGEALLWGGQPAPRRGPKALLNRGKVVRAGIEIADAEGLAALSMQRVAAKLGAATMALYRHVPGKFELVTLMLDAAIGEPPELPDGTGWRTGLAAWARGNRDVFVRHPWTLSLVTGSRTMGPNELAWTEAALRVTSATGLPTPALLDVLMLVNGYVRGAVVDLAGGPVVPGPETLRRLGLLERYPVLAGVLAQAREPEGAASREHRFEFGLARVLDGVGQYVRDNPG
ncbi:MAG TPA: TetR/AcrR family transcriptional regulator C-terminal domain-containing protein [Pseudonocardia sp.]|nr:TetR/AcrR family transcriptional regulator C-terminal domain-containing protein [Pseudonocardia sp.]